MKCVSIVSYVVNLFVAEAFYDVYEFQCKIKLKAHTLLFLPSKTILKIHEEIS